MIGNIVSADSHVVEPANLWLERVDRGFRDDAPRLVPNADGSGFSLVAQGLPPSPIGFAFATGSSNRELAEAMNKGHEAARPSGWDPAERLKDQDVDGVVAEVLYCSLGMPLFRLPGAELQAACFRAYNDWLADFASYNPRRLCPIALISVKDIPLAAQELERCAKRGFKGAQIAGGVPRDRPYHSRDYDPLWERAQELGMALSLHVATGQPDYMVTTDTLMLRYMVPVHEIQLSFASLICGGVLERYPRLNIVSAENDAGWLPHFMQRLDHGQKKYGVEWPAAKLSMMPSDYVRRQIWATFQEDCVGPMTHRYFGEDRYMWASDFPHSDSTWPNSREVIDRDFKDIPEQVTRKIVCDNAVKLYGIDVA